MGRSFHRDKRHGFRYFMLDYQYHVMVASLVAGLICVGAYKLFEAHWFLSRFVLLLTIMAFTPAAVVVFAHSRAVGAGWYWDPSNSEWITRRSQKTEKVELILLSALWLLIFLFVIYVVFRR